MTPRETEQLVLLIEECAEVQQAATKILRHGWEGRDPCNETITNRAALELELGDLKAVLELLFRSGHVSTACVDVRFSVKRAVLRTSPHVYFQRDDE